MSKWLWAAILVLQAHFAASYVAPIDPRLGWFNYVWPWAAGDRGLLGVHPNILGIALAGSAGLASLLAALSIVGLWLPHEWWRSLTIVGAGVELILMIGYFGPTKLLPIALDVAVLLAAGLGWLPLTAD
jgi:hypothetical protein